MGKIVINGRTINSIEIQGKKVTKIEINGSVITFGVSHTNTFKGHFSSRTVEQNFLNLRDRDGQTFKNEIGITAIRLPDITTLRDSAFSGCSNLADVDLPELKLLDYYAFNGCNITKLNIPKLERYDNMGYVLFSIVNSPSTNITMPSKFNTNNDKDKLFGAGNWNNVTFHYV